MSRFVTRFCTFNKHKDASFFLVMVSSNGEFAEREIISPT